MVKLKCSECGCIFHRNIPIDNNKLLWRYGELVNLTDCPDCNSNNTDVIQDSLGVIITIGTPLRIAYLKQKFHQRLGNK